MDTKKIMCDKITCDDFEGQIRRSINQSEIIAQKERCDRLIDSPITIEEKIIKVFSIKSNSQNEL